MTGLLVKDRCMCEDERAGSDARPLGSDLGLLSLWLMLADADAPLPRKVLKLSKGPELSIGRRARREADGGRPCSGKRFGTAVGCA